MSSTRTLQWNLIRLMLYSALVATVYSFCNEPLNLTFAVHDGTKDNYTEGETVTYSCIEGFNTNPSVNNNSTCEPDEKWTPILPDLCRKLQCDIPDILENGNVEFQDSELGSIASYTCLKGYILFGDDKRQCLADEKWNGKVPLCNRTCSAPPNLQFTNTNTSTSPADGYYPQSTQVTYTCIRGFTPNISLPSFTTCQSDFTWTQITDFCMRKSCGSPGTLENGKVVKENDKFESRAEFVCDEGYMLVGNKYRECLEDGAWSGSVPTCRKSCPNPPTLNSSEIVWLPDNGYFPVGIIITYKCLPGYKYDLFLIPIIQCLEGFTWSNTTEFCKKVICGEPERIKNGNVDITGTDFGSVAKYSCNPGFKMTGNAQRKCTEDGVWEGIPPTCQ